MLVAQVMQAAVWVALQAVAVAPQLSAALVSQAFVASWSQKVATVVDVPPPPPQPNPSTATKIRLPHVVSLVIMAEVSSAWGGAVKLQ